MSVGARAGALLAAGLLLAGCGSTERQSVTNVLVPAQQQRADLMRAHEMRLLSDVELQAQLAKIGR